ncbi:uncharacterized protein LOC123211752 [Mangifera indica]|uniref:uncharacterized protein LOC123211752 n=1 Tax=Mangifera indica TaxID=29780 RepID=UPI001CFC297C|nr:uncharacterized protein LOC123211752 [Mangifera indica]
MSPYRLVFGKAYRLPIELENRAYWVVKHCNMKLDESGGHRKLQLQELKEIHNDAYESKLRSRWIGPFIVTNVFPHGVVEIQSLITSKVFQVNGHRLKPFYEGVPTENVEEVELKDPVYMDK